MMSEWLLIVIVTLLAFGPKKLPLLAKHLGMALRWFLQIKANVEQVWQKQVQQQLLEISEQKAEAADKLYQQKEL